MGFTFFIYSCTTTTEVRTFNSLDEYPVYENSDLGVTYTPAATSVRIWSPAAEQVRFHLYAEGVGDNRLETHDLRPDVDGTWIAELEGDQQNRFYTIQVMQEGAWLEEKPDIHARAVGVNGNRGMIIDLEETNPEGWETDVRPPLGNYTDIIIYELHVRDISNHPSSNIQHAGKYLGLTETGTKNQQGDATGLDHISELGVTHVHLLPAFDHRSIDETRLDEPQYNWGYDPQNYNVPEGSFSTNPYDGRVRIREFKEMVQALHKQGLRVILDVVYNHTGQTLESNFSQLVPGYFYRQNPDGTFSDASACGNETASDREMMRKFMIESVKYWANEYHLDGFRFDLMGIHDIETMNEISYELRRIDPSIFVYGEGWTAGNSPLPEPQRALKKHTYQMPHVAAFSDDIRDGLKGSVFEHEDTGFASGKPGMKESVKFGIVASTQHPQVDYEQVNYSDEPWAAQPSQTINYVSCHDNHTLFDRLTISRPDASPDEIAQMHKLANTVVLTSQGVPFLHAGVDFMRTKFGVENSYNSPDSINVINWDRKTQYRDHFEYYQALIALRKAHPAFRMDEQSKIAENLKFISIEDPHVLSYVLNGQASGDSWNTILLVFNGSGDNKTYQLPEGSWTMVNNGKKIDPAGLGKKSGSVPLPAYSALIFYSNQ
ncbi:type I pullulanase [Fulvivirga sedimenti]|uniref:Type I pullulanase n=1 Tax=Fulvivirga sedimenti TaxID=2879465 RepID=A0A9X1HVX3_9BACT|nr:type I pullulanase [Fulvivirga sedimenti]MCA6078846.1 type I pullulanase [Fulvivirga sedimenti]